MYDNRERWYSPSLSRFVSVDPVWGTNLYSAYANAPVNAVDPNGTYLIAKNREARDRFVRWWRGLGLLVEVRDLPDGRSQLIISINGPAAIQRALGANLTAWDRTVLRSGKNEAETYHVEMSDDATWTLTQDQSEYPLIPRRFLGEWKVAICVDMAGSKTGHAWIRYRQGNQEYTIGKILGAAGMDYNTDVGRHNSSQEATVCREVTVMNPEVIFTGGGYTNNCALYAQEAYVRITGDSFLHTMADNPRRLMAYIWSADVQKRGSAQASTTYRNWNPPR